MLQKAEGFDVEFKENPNAIDTEDIVAFANSKDGGYILAGVREKTDISGTQRGEIIGCDVSDRIRQAILSRAGSCVPSINIMITVENLNTKPILRIYVPSGNNKPYCNGNGTYKIRGDGRNRAWFPQSLLLFFLENEYQDFSKRFTKTTKGITESISEVRQKVEGNLEGLLRELNWMGTILQESLAEISGTTEDAGGIVEDTNAAIGEIHYFSQEMYERFMAVYDFDFPDIEERMKAMMESMEIQDPVRLNIKRQVVEHLKKSCTGKESDEKMAGIIQEIGGIFPRASYSEIIKWYKEIFPD